MTWPKPPLKVSAEGLIQASSVAAVVRLRFAASADLHPAAAVEVEGLPHSAGGVADAAHQGTGVADPGVAGVAFAPPRTDQASGRQARDAAVAVENGQTDA